MLNNIAFFGAIETGLIYGLVAMGVFLSFRVLNFPDLTVEGSFPLGASVAAMSIIGGLNPWLACFLALLAGMLAGVVTGLLNIKLRILHILASILVMTALYSINLRIMGRPNVALLGENTILTFWEQFPLPYYLIPVLLFSVIIGVVGVLLYYFMKSEIGLAMRATGTNPRMAQSQGINTGSLVILGIAMANGLTALAGALFAQSQGSADATMGVGVIVVALASLIGGEALLAPKNLARALIGCVLGAIVYRLVIAIALNANILGLQAQDLNLITAILVTLAIFVPLLRQHKQTGEH